MKRVVPTNLKVNKIGKYLYKNIETAYKCVTSSNTCDVYMVVYYDYSYPGEKPDDEQQVSDLMEMDINLSLTTYKNKIRVNIYELTPDDYTIGFLRYEPEELDNLEYAKKLILNDVIDKISNRYSKYEFMF